MTEYNLFVDPSRSTETEPTLCTSVARKEGETVGVATCQLFTSKENVAAFFNLSENSALLGKPLLQIQGIKKSTSEDVGTDTLYALLVGSLSMILDRRLQQARKATNVVFKVDTSKGSNDGFITVVIQTHNKCGLSARGAFAADFGETFVYHPKTHSSPSNPNKRFKNVLNMLCQKKSG